MAQLYIELKMTPDCGLSQDDLIALYKAQMEALFAKEAA